MKTAMWERKPLGLVADLCLGKMLDQNKNRGEPLPYLANVNVRWGEFSLDDLRTMRFEDKEMERYGLKFGDIVMCEGGEPGRCAIWKDQIPGMMIQKALHRIRPKNILDYRFLFYSFLNIGYSKGFDQFFTGATIKHLPGEKLAKLEVDIPPLSVQQRIADILSAYDELIENTQRRIGILETMARSLYREWFVNFRFPGHEKVQRVPSALGEIPKGWQPGIISDICESVSYGYTTSATENEVGPKFLRITDIVPEVINWRRVPYCEVAPADEEKYLLTEGDIVIARTGATTGYAKRLNKLHPETVFASYLVRARAKQGVSNRMLGILMESDDYKRYIKTNIGGSAQPQANAVVLTSMPIIVPTQRVSQAFDEIVESILDRSELLAITIEILRRTRDLLLPRLLSGQIPTASN